MKIENPGTNWVLAVGCMLAMAMLASRQMEFGFRIPPAATQADDPPVGIRLTSLRADRDDDSTDRLDGRQLLLDAANRLYQAEPFQATARLRVNLFGQQMTTLGTYCQVKGARGSRLEFTYGDADQPSSILQIGDGQFHYQLESNDQQAKMSVANLLELAEADEHRLLGEVFNWKNQGGLAHLLANLADSFEFEPVAQGSLGDTPVLVVNGQWDPDRLRHYLHGQINPGFLRPEIQWDNLPPHLPRSVKVVLGNDDFFPLFPYQIAYYRPDDQADGEHINIATMELYELNLQAELPEELFRVDSGAMKLDDVTPREVHRLRGLNDAVRAAEASKSINRTR